jgi:hypothetical protein
MNTDLNAGGATRTLIALRSSHSNHFRYRPRRSAHTGNSATIGSGSDG